MSGEIPEDRGDAPFGVRRSVRHRSARRRFFSSWSKAASFVSVIAGASTISSLLAQAPAQVSVAVAAVVAVAQAAELVFGFSGKAAAHHGFYRDFIALEARISGVGDNPDRSLPASWTAARPAAEASEPPIRRWLDVLRHNDLAGSLGFEDQVRPATWLQRQLAQLADLSPVHRQAENQFPVNWPTPTVRSRVIILFFHSYSISAPA